MTKAVRALLLCALILSPWGAGFADEPLVTVKPEGQPIRMDGHAVRYFLWYDAEGWHLRTDSNGRRHIFSGSIKIIGGKITKVSNFEDLEAGAKTRWADVGSVNKAKNQITFKFTTSIKRDGFDFVVDEAATEIKFSLLIDAKAAPQRVLIGPASQPSPTEVLVLPAHPES